DAGRAAGGAGGERQGRRAVSPAADLLGIDFDVVHLLGMHLLHPIEGGVVEYVRPVFCLAQRAEMLARVVQRGRDHAGDQWHLTDRLPIRLIGFRRGEGRGFGPRLATGACPRHSKRQLLPVSPSALARTAAVFFASFVSFTHPPSYPPSLAAVLLSAVFAAFAAAVLCGF